MAFGVTVVQARGQGAYPKTPAPVLELPPVRADKVTADGTVALVAGARSFELVNHGDVAVWFKVQLATDNAQASAADTLSLPLGAGATYPFMLPDGADPALWEVDIRTA